MRAVRSDPLGLLYLGVTAVGWGSAWVPLKLLLAELPPLTMRAAAGLLAAALLAATMRALGTSLAVPRGLWPRLWLISGLNVGAWMGFSAFAVQWLGAAEACLICYTAPAWTVLFAWPVLGERPTAGRVTGLLAGLGGLLLVVGPPGPALAERLPGVLCALAAAILFALGTVLIKRRPLALPPMAAVVWQVALGSVAMLAGALLLEWPPTFELSPPGWLLLVYMAAMPLGVCYLAWFAALRRLPATLAGIGSLVAPIIGVLSAAAVLGEPFGLRQGLALVLVLGGVALAARG